MYILMRESLRYLTAMYPFVQVGLYQETVHAYEVVLGDGSLVHARRDNEYSDLYHCLPWSHGTLGFLVALEVKIIPVKVKIDCYVFVNDVVVTLQSSRLINYFCLN
jgi:FAD/FMN-containing dehydrogenase